MASEMRSSAILRFGTFEVDLRAGELRKQGKRIRLQDQPLQVLSVLLQRSGDVVTREELRKQISPEDSKMGHGSTSCDPHFYLRHQGTNDPLPHAKRLPLRRLRSTELTS